MKTYSKELIVAQDDLDELEHVNNVRYVQWIQDISKEHWLRCAPPALRENTHWVVMTHHIQYKAAAVLGDPLRLVTHIEKSRGAISVRVVHIHHAKTNTLFVRSSTEWVLLNADTQKPIRIPKEVQEIFS
ncbi:acyl-CoA thioesterase [Maribacter sp. 2307ULW6-5]|uniref:acyl-CoA thioesterase n=1 Tax=Maribacter sp. 2307ULW6-5 TaxID=3386275 RepID=UPI0039BCE83F